MRKRLADEVVALRPWRESDAPEIVAAVDGDGEMARWLDGMPQPYRLQHALAYIRGEILPEEEKYAITDAERGSVLGSIGIRWSEEGDVATVGYWLRADARNRGCTTRALVLVSRHAFAAGAARVQLYADPENVASCRVAERAGFTREGVLRSYHWNPRLGRRQDWAIYGLLRSES